VQPCAEWDDAQSLALAASLASHSTHPVSQAIGRASTPAMAVSAFRELPGRGIQGTLADQTWWLGNHRLMQAVTVLTPAIEQQRTQLEAAGNTVVMLANAAQVVALFAVADGLKAGSREAIAELHQLGVKTVMLSGDNQTTVAAIAAEVGIDRALGEQLPQDKLDAVAALTQSGTTAMVGDGINDAPALARADIGIAMGVMGSDTALATADVALMDDDLRKLPQFIRCSRMTWRILRQNIALAIGLKVLFLLLTLMGWGTLWMAVFADVGASLLVTANGLRLLRMKL
jgi:Cd2+/Zn2+-exporting ATPase